MVLKPPEAAQKPTTDPNISGQAAFKYPETEVDPGYCLNYKLEGVHRPIVLRSDRAVQTAVHWVDENGITSRDKCTLKTAESKNASQVLAAQLYPPSGPTVLPEPPRALPSQSEDDFLFYRAEHAISLCLGKARGGSGRTVGPEGESSCAAQIFVDSAVLRVPLFNQVCQEPEGPLT